MTRETSQHSLSPESSLRNIQRYMELFGISVCFHALERWESLPQDIQSPDTPTFITGLTHECLTDGQYVRLALHELSTWQGIHELEYVALVYAEGLKSSLRRAVAGLLTVNFPIDKENPEIAQIRVAQDEAKKSATLVFVQGTRKPQAEIKEGMSVMTALQDSVIYPYIALGLDKPIFPAKSSVRQNLLALLARATFARKKSQVHFVAGEPIHSEELTEIKKRKFERKKEKRPLTVVLENRRLQLLRELVVIYPEITLQYPWMIAELSRNLE